MKRKKRNLQNKQLKQPCPIRYTYIYTERWKIAIQRTKTYTEMYGIQLKRFSTHITVTTSHKVRIIYPENYHISIRLSYIIYKYFPVRFNGDQTNDDIQGNFMDEIESPLIFFRSWCLQRVREERQVKESFFIFCVTS